MDLDVFLGVASAFGQAAQTERFEKHDDLRG